MAVGNDANEARDRDSYLRWQTVALEQLGYVINLYFTLSAVVLGFAVKTMMDSKVPFPICAQYMFHTSLLFLVLSIASSLAANTARAMDFRYTRRAAHARWKGKLDDRASLQDKAENCGKWTWWFFYCQTLAFGLGSLLLCLSIWIRYGRQV